MRPESPLLRAARQLDYDAHRLRAVDAILYIVGAAVLLAVLVASMIRVIDWMEGRPDSIVPAIVAFLDVIDGGAR